VLVSGTSKSLVDVLRRTKSVPIDGRAKKAIIYGNEPPRYIDRIEIKSTTAVASIRAIRGDIDKKVQSTHEDESTICTIL
jgi:hypothetical protein